MPKKKGISKQEQLDEIAQALAVSSCPLRVTATRAVPGEGNSDADILFIGEAPGKNEDLTGRPFIGAAGKVLSGLLESIRMTREEVFITSIEKFRPPQNRDPKPEEVEACFPFLERQIEVIRPKIIVPMGRHALRWILEWEKGEGIAGNIAMETFHGKAIRGKKGYLYFPIHHPAALLYNRSLTPMVEKEFAMIPKLLKKERSLSPRA